MAEESRRKGRNASGRGTGAVVGIVSLKSGLVIASTYKLVVERVANLRLAFQQ